MLSGVSGGGGGRGGGGGQGEDARSLEDGEAEKGQEEVEDERQAGQGQVDGASGSSHIQLSHSGRKTGRWRTMARRESVSCC